MIKYHPNSELLTQFVQGTLPASLSVAVSAHHEMCPQCAKQVADIEAKQADVVFEEPRSDEASTLDDAFSAMMSDIVADADIDEFSIESRKELTFGERSVTLPRSLSHIAMSRFVQAGKLARSRLDLDEGSIRTSLLYIAPGGSIPEHTHTGFELTLLLDGTFHDEHGEYVPGDFIWLDHQHDHTPVTENGCLCLAVVNSALHFNKGLSKLLNPIGELIY